MPSTVEEIAHEPRHLIGLLEMWQVAGVVDKLDMGARDPLRELVGIGRRDHLIPIPPDDQGRHRDPVEACDQMKLAWASTRAAGSAGSAKNRSAAAPAGSAKRTPRR